MSQPLTVRAIYRWPVAVGLLTLFGLIAGLLCDGWGDLAAAGGLSVPILISAWFAVCKK
jgi:hypothetical protein